MAIPQEEYINITSSIVRDAVSNRELIGRVLSRNEIIPLEGIEFSSLASVKDYFGKDADEYLFASKYFGLISKDGKKPRKISFCKYEKPKGNGLNGVIFSKIGWKSSAGLDIKSTDGDILKMNLKLGEKEYNHTFNAPSVNITDWTSLAEHLNTSINGKYEGLTISVEYEPEPSRLIFKITSSSKIEVSFSGKYANTFGLDTPVVVSGMSAPNGWDEMMDWIDDANNNFGSFCFLAKLSDLDTTDITSVANWNHNKNVKYLYVQAVSFTKSSSISEALSSINGTWLQLSNLTEDDEQIPLESFAPMAIGATLNYNRVNTNAFFDFYPVDGLDIQVDNKSDYDKYTKERVNFNGITQQGGRLISFLQPGYLTGDISDAGVYYNEMWLKDDIWTRLMALFLAVKKIPANEVGKIQCKNTIMSTIEQAKVNGSILVGKTLTNAQKAQIQEYTNDDNAVNKIQDDGFYLTLDINRTTFVDSNNKDIEKYIVSYSLLYAKGDGIRKVEGTNILY